MMMRSIFVGVLLLAISAVQGAETEPVVRIGLDQNASSVTIRSAAPFNVEQTSTRTAKFTPILALDTTRNSRTLRKDDLRYRMIVELDGGRLLVRPMASKIRISPGKGGDFLQIESRSYRGAIEVFGNGRNSLTLVNELPLEAYLLGVVPNELSPRTFGQIDALKAQAVAARTYIVRNMGQYKKEGYDICATDSCQVYFGAGTEDPMATLAVEETSGVIATYKGQPINALYSSTCGGRTEDAENIFDEKLPYLVSTVCEYKHPEPLPFSSSRSFSDWKDAVLAVAGVANFAEAQRFMGLSGPLEVDGPQPSGASELASFIRKKFYPDVRTSAGDLAFLTEQGILSPNGPLPEKEILFRLIEKKGAFEWRQGVLVSWDGQMMKLLINGQPSDFRLSPDAPIYQRIGDERVSQRQGSWIGGELLDFREVDGAIQMVVFRINFANPAADRFSRLALWQVHRTRQELDTAFASLNIGELRDFRVIERGPSERPLSTEVIGSMGTRAVRALRIRTLLGLRDSLFYFDEERNAQGDLIGMTFYGRGWGHGVGMCQVGAFGMALGGATYEQILKKYYTGIDIKKLY